MGFVLSPEAQAHIDAQKAKAAEGFELLSWNVRAVRAFLDNSTQWRVAPMGGYVGLDHIAVRGDLIDKGYKRKRRKTTMARVRTIERAALAEWARQREADKESKADG